MNCYKSSNNKFFNAPSRMSDGRIFTDYRHNAELNDNIMTNNKVLNSYDYRMFLTRNSDNIIKGYNEYTFIRNGNLNCKLPYETGSMLPEKTRVICNKHTCNSVVVNENGFGEGRTYNTTDKPNTILEPLKQPEMTNLDPNLCASLSDNFEYYPINTNRTDQEFLDNKILPNGSKIMTGGDPNPSIVN
jgi:hypothetical protein